MIIIEYLTAGWCYLYSFILFTTMKIGTLQKLTLFRFAKDETYSWTRILSFDIIHVVEVIKTLKT